MLHRWIQGFNPDAPAIWLMRTEVLLVARNFR